jgi:hypothetical protein
MHIEDKQVVIVPHAPQGCPYRRQGNVEIGSQIVSYLLVCYLDRVLGGHCVDISQFDGGIAWRVDKLVQYAVLQGERSA